MCGRVVVLLCAAAALQVLCAAAQPGCETARPLLLKQGLAQHHILDTPLTGIGTGGTCGCCGTAAATKLSGDSRRNLENTAKTHAAQMKSVFSAKAKYFDEVFLELLKKSKRGLHEMFTRTYGMIYEKHAHLFSELFTQLEQYYNKGGLDLARAMDGFFAVLYKKMFTVINSQYYFDEKYLTCVSEHMTELQPFGDVPQKLAIQVKRAFVATRTFTRSLSAAAEVARNMGNVRVSNWCGANNHCKVCSGIVAHQCKHLCLNIARACLPQYADISSDWDAFVDTMDKVADRLIGPFNIANVVEPINIKISEAIMNFQDHAQDLSQKVFSGCGKPVLGQRPSDPGYFTHSRQTRSAHKDNSDDFEIETSSYENLLKKNPFVLSRGNSRMHLSDDKVTDLKSRSNLNFKIDHGNDLDDSGLFADKLKDDKRLVSDRLLRFKRDANPEAAAKNSKEIEFESYNFNNNEQRNNRGGGNKKKPKKKPGNGKKKKIDLNGNDFNEEEEDILNRLVREIRSIVCDTRHSWVLLPHTHCGIDSGANSQNYGSDDKCWNGTNVGRYLPPLAGEGSAALATNPEARSSSLSGASSSSTPTAATVNTQQFTLRSISNKLKNAYNGLDVEWRQDVDQSSTLLGSGSGSGYDDSETSEPDRGGPPDQEEDTEGSGIHSENNFDKYPEPDITEDNFHPSVVINKHPTDTISGNVDLNENEIELEHDNNHIDTNSIKEIATASGVEKEEMSLQRALITYLFPIVCVWFGGIITDIA